MSESALSRILAPGGLRALFQPVLTSHGSAWQVSHVEALTRGPSRTNLEPANVLFEYVRLKRQEIAVDRACLSAVLEKVPLLPPRTHVSINVHASTLGRDGKFVPFLQKALYTIEKPPEEVSIEVVEHAPPWDSASFLESLEALRKIGIRIALDDVGLGQSNFKMILDVHPDFLKIDRYFVRECHLDPNRQAVIESIQHLANRFGAKVIAEGVETEDEVELLRKFGIDLLQGFYFAPAVEVEELSKLNFHRSAEELVDEASGDSRFDGAVEEQSLNERESQSD